MSAFLRRFIDNKKYVLLLLSIMLIMGFIYGFVEYGHCQETIKKNFHYLFYLKIISKIISIKTNKMVKKSN